MEEIKVTRSEEVIVYAESDSGVHHNVVIVNGEIARTSWWTERSSGYTKYPGEESFIDVCTTSIRFITTFEPAKLKKIYHALSDGPMKDFCKQVQAEKIAELQF